MEGNKNNTYKAFLYAIGALGGTLLSGVAISLLWGWFIAEPFGIMKISIPQAIGIDILITSITTSFSSYYDLDKLSNSQKCAISLVVPLGSLIIGWIVHLFM